MAKKRIGSWQDIYLGDVGAMSWNGSVLTSGLARGEVRLLDTRSSEIVGKVTKHKSKVIGCRWSTDGLYLATSDKQGNLNVWDWRAGKELADSDRLGGRLKHGGPVKVCSDLLVFPCPDKIDLLSPRPLLGARGSQNSWPQARSIPTARSESST